jgi:hypothetical protein
MEPVTAPPPPHANGRARPVTLVPLTLPAHGGWPQGDPGRWRHAVSAFRRNWWRLVFASVGAVAAVVSYGHIVGLFLSWHAPLLDARLMPVAIDGLIIIGAGAARGGQKKLGWSAIGPGLAASLYANVMNGLPYGYGAAMGSGWATVALFLATNVMERWKAAPAVTPRHDARHDGVPDDAVDGGSGDGDDDVRPPSPEPPPGPPPSPPRNRQRGPSGKAARALAVIKRHPGLSDAQVAAKAGVSESTARRARNGKTGSRP